MGRGGGRLPGGIIDDFRDTIVNTIPHSSRFLHSAHPGLTSGTAGSKSSGTRMGTAEDTRRIATAPSFLQRPGLETDMLDKYQFAGRSRPQTMQEKRRQALMSSNSKYPLRPGRATAPRNFFTSPPKKGHYASVPWTNIGNAYSGVMGEYTYAIEGPPAHHQPVLMPSPQFKPSSPSKRSVGLGTNFGLFSKPQHLAHGPIPRFSAFEATSNRMIAQSLYPVQVLPTVLAKS